MRRGRRWPTSQARRRPWRKWWHTSRRRGRAAGPLAPTGAPNTPDRQETPVTTAGWRAKKLEQVGHRRRTRRLEYLTGEEIGSAVDAIAAPPVPLGVPIATAAADPVFPGRWAARHYMVADKADSRSGTGDRSGGLEFADDYVSGFAQAGTHCDALGHMWLDDTLWNGYPAASTNGGMTKRA